MGYGSARCRLQADLHVGAQERMMQTHLTSYQDPLPEKGKDAVERVMKYVVIAEEAVIVDQIKEETCKDTQLQNLSVRILNGDREQHPKYFLFYMKWACVAVSLKPV